jgi:hypothetical protein
MRFVEPVLPYEVRDDTHGSGLFGAPRGTLPGGAKRYHDGEDALVFPGQLIRSPIDGFAEKVDYPYSSDLSWTGIQLANDLVRVEIWYMQPDKVIGQRVFSGQIIGRAQAIGDKYNTEKRVKKYGGKMQHHVHIRVTLLGFSALSKGVWVQPEIVVNPKLLLGG